MEQETNQTAPPPDRKYNWLYTKAYGIALALGSFQFGILSLQLSLRIYDDHPQRPHVHKRKE